MAFALQRLRLAAFRGVTAVLLRSPVLRNGPGVEPCAPPRSSKPHPRAPPPGPWLKAGPVFVASRGAISPSPARHFPLSFFSFLCSCCAVPCCSGRILALRPCAPLFRWREVSHRAPGAPASRAFCPPICLALPHLPHPAKTDLGLGTEDRRLRFPLRSTRKFHDRPLKVHCVMHARALGMVTRRRGLSRACEEARGGCARCGPLLDGGGQTAVPGLR